MHVLTNAHEDTLKHTLRDTDTQRKAEKAHTKTLTTHTHTQARINTLIYQNRIIKTHRQTQTNALSLSLKHIRTDTKRKDVDDSTHFLA